MWTLNLTLQIKRERSNNFLCASDAQKSPIFTHAYFFICHLNTGRLDILKRKENECAKNLQELSLKNKFEKKQQQPYIHRNHRSQTYRVSGRSRPVVDPAER